MSDGAYKLRSKFLGGAYKKNAFVHIAVQHYNSWSLKDQVEGKSGVPAEILNDETEDHEPYDLNNHNYILLIDNGKKEAGNDIKEFRLKLEAEFVTSKCDVVTMFKC